MTDPIQALRITEDISRSLLELKNQTGKIRDSLGNHPVDICLRGMIETRQRLFMLYGMDMWKEANEHDEHFSLSEADISSMPQ